VGLLEPHGRHRRGDGEADLSAPRTFLSSKGVFSGAFAISLIVTTRYIHDVTLLAYFGPLAILLLAWELTVGKRLTFEPAQGIGLIWPAVLGSAIPIVALILAKTVTTAWKI
jgi:hypothetical protein